MCFRFSILTQKLVDVHWKQSEENKWYRGISEQICPVAHSVRKYRPHVHWMSQLDFVTWLIHCWSLKVWGIIYFFIKSLRLHICWIPLSSQLIPSWVSHFYYISPHFLCSVLPHFLFYSLLLLCSSAAYISHCLNTIVKLMPHISILVYNLHKSICMYSIGWDI